ncbi:galactose dehydrogenase, putative [Coccidioides posadasii C735 delta SOWgp]|uniref:L-galactose dehydrogenase n=3 Tax=Coccidioides posadasii TaxID=199306 RepID=E9D8Q9_COCPS|nr:galactose dehydrogenase, putative [Coccidioides posadasii C735 delta SOWgp]EER29670.1 galactose dehydrogenase, putative [Coccidioides posadasii C735 delta SOWgp]EFW16943.1 L-galactose dehydrogenase [Coccidioides posadasii str. Silveira]|eukprot:XP_003071815.1 galactose dehydrogenase, putative [Coccidioides posadasii C735 delta SOWgp]
MASKGKPEIPLSADLPPLIMGTATFNSQYNVDPFALPTTALVHRAFSAGVRAFDTSPYYGPAEELLGYALSTPFVRDNYPRHKYRLITKVGRLASASFDYSPTWIRRSLARSLSRLNTQYLDLVYCHDVEFVSAEEVLVAVKELRRIRDEEGTIRYVGISGYPVGVLCDLAERILRETGEPLDAVMSYANFTVQNTRLVSEALPRLLAAGVDVVPNASPLGLGLLRRHGVPIGSMGDFHPAPVGLRDAVREASRWVEEQGERIEIISIRYALEAWLREGSAVGSLGEPLASSSSSSSSSNGASSQTAAPTGRKLGISVMGVSKMEELDETLRVWREIIGGLEEIVDIENSEKALTEHADSVTVRPTASQDSSLSILPVSDNVPSHERSHIRRQEILALVTGIRKVLGQEWVDFTWLSPEKGFTNQPPPPGYDKDIKY